MKIVRLKTNHLINPVGYWMDEAVVTFTVVDSLAMQKESARIVVALDSHFDDLVFDSGHRNDIDESGFPLPLLFKPMTRYYWKVYVKAGNEEAWSDVAYFETPRSRKATWKAEFITQSFSQDENPVFVKDLQLQARPAKNRMYAIGLGAYEMYVNGKKVGKECLLPGIHDYDSYLQYETFILPFKKGHNVIEARCGCAWYKGQYGLTKPYPAQNEHCFIAEIHLWDESGNEAILGSDSTWMCRKNQVRTDGIYSGELYDASFMDAALHPTKILSNSRSMKKRLCPRISPPITVHERIKPNLLTTSKNEYVLDMGQNMVGWLEFKADLPKGTRIHFLFGEILQDGCFYRENLRSAEAAFTYIASGKQEVVRQHYTFYGFRYVKLEGFPEKPNPAWFRGLVIHSEMEETARLSTSSEDLNQLISNVRWGMKGNFLDTPTDCPQRDERMGWTGDAQIFSDTALFLADTYAFYSKYLHDLASEQKKYGGSVPYVVPAPRYPLHGASVWGDAATVIPWNSFVHFGDASILKAQYQSMRDWVEYMRNADVESGNRHLWMTGNQFGDWLALDATDLGGFFGATDAYFIASAYYFHSVGILAKAARILSKEKDADFYSSLQNDIRTAFIHEYFTKKGRLAIDTQTAYALAIGLDLFPDETNTRLGRDFRKRIKADGFKLTTGFVGTPFLCSSLLKSGNEDLAFNLLFRKEYPGWLYEVALGATTIWERWDSVLPDGRISGTTMNSLNHYAYGSILAWIIRDIVGFAPDEASPGFKNSIISPHPADQLKSVEGTFMTPYGEYAITWKKHAKSFSLIFTVPFGCTAKVLLPRGASLPFNGNLPWEHDEVSGCYVALVHAGKHRVDCTLKGPYERTYTLERAPLELMADRKARKVILKYFPSFRKKVPGISVANTMEDVLRLPFVMTTESVIQSVQKELELLNES